MDYFDIKDNIFLTYRRQPPPMAQLATSTVLEHIRKAIHDSGREEVPPTDIKISLSKTQRQLLRRMNFTSTEELQRRLHGSCLGGAMVQFQRLKNHLLANPTQCAVIEDQDVMNLLATQTLQTVKVDLHAIVTYGKTCIMIDRSVQDPYQMVMDHLADPTRNKISRDCKEMWCRACGVSITGRPSSLATACPMCEAGVDMVEGQEACQHVVDAFLPPNLAECAKHGHEISVLRTKMKHCLVSGTSQSFQWAHPNVWRSISHVIHDSSCEGGIIVTEALYANTPTCKWCRLRLPVIVEKTERGTTRVFRPTDIGLDNVFCSGDCRGGYEAFMALVRKDVRKKKARKDKKAKAMGSKQEPTATEEEKCSGGDGDGGGALEVTDECAVCLLELNDSQALKKPCPASDKHVFHVQCWESVVKMCGSQGRTLFCPTCMTEVV